MARPASIVSLFFLWKMVSRPESVCPEDQGGEQGAESDQAEDQRETEPGESLILTEHDKPPCGAQPFHRAGDEQPLHESDRQWPPDEE